MNTRIIYLTIALSLALTTALAVACGPIPGGTGYVSQILKWSACSSGYQTATQIVYKSQTGSCPASLATTRPCNSPTARTYGTCATYSDWVTATRPHNPCDPTTQDNCVRDSGSGKLDIQCDRISGVAIKVPSISSYNMRDDYRLT
jgi:hypothetical protein